MDKMTSDKRILVDAKTLAEMLGCGEASARKFGTEAGAHIQIGRRSLFSVVRIEEYVAELLQ